VRHPTGELAIVSHGGVIASLLADWLGADYDRLLRRLSLDNAGISAVDRRTNPPRVLWINDTDHLINHA
jgi:broad specificity phosphatase PhoE